jgi:hypothetical protein
MLYFGRLVSKVKCLKLVASVIGKFTCRFQLGIESNEKWFLRLLDLFIEK